MANRYPSTFLKFTPEEEKKARQLGFVFDGDVVEIPKGWGVEFIRRPNDDLLKDEVIVNDKGRARVSCEPGSISLLRRFGIGDVYERQLFGIYFVRKRWVKISTAVLKQRRATEIAEQLFRSDNESYAYNLYAYNNCERWLNQHYPDWRDPLAYWDID